MDTDMNILDAYKIIFTSFPDVVDIDTMCKMLGNMGKKSAYALLRSGEIKCLKNCGGTGRGYKIPKISIIQYLLNAQAIDEYIA